MTTNTFVFPVTFTQLWVEGSLQLMRATGEFWSGVLGAAPARATSTASPWWMPPQQSRSIVNTPLWPGAFAAAAWAQAMPFAAPSGVPLASWLPASRAGADLNPFALWQQMLLNATGPSAHPAWQPNATTAANGLWQPVATAYRTANGHAMAAVLRTMADVVEPKAQGFTPAHYWPSTLGTHH